MEVKEDPEGCPQCAGRVFYRKSTYFGRKVYYKVCNKCGWYRVYPKNEWLHVCFGISASTEEENDLEELEETSDSTDTDKVEEKTELSDQDDSVPDTVEKEQNNTPESATDETSEPPRKKGRKRGRKPKKKPDIDSFSSDQDKPAG